MLVELPDLQPGQVMIINAQGFCLVMYVSVYIITFSWQRSAEIRIEGVVPAEHMKDAESFDKRSLGGPPLLSPPGG